MMNAAINAAAWVVGKALGPVGDTVLEAWAASTELGPNFEALTTELLHVQAILHGIRNKEIQNPPLERLLQKLRDRAHDADDVLDELDYFRIQDQLYGTPDTAEKHAKGCAHNLVLNESCGRRARGTISSAPHTDQAEGEVNGCMPKLTSGVCNTIRAVGKRLPCSSLPHVHDDDDDDNHSGMLVLHGGTHIPPLRMLAEETPKLRFNRVGVSKRMKDIADDLLTMRKGLSNIIKILGPAWSTIPDIAQKRPITTSESIEPQLYGRDCLMNSIIHDITQGKYCSENLTVLPIVGPGGIGKTTLTQHIYHNPKVQNHFEIRVWTCVSLSFNVDKLTAEIVKCLPEVNDQTKGTDGELIEQRLKSKRFLLVLDDMWTFSSEDEWKRLLLPFKKSQVKGNIIMVTTRFPALALEHEEFKKFFLQLVFGDEQSGNYDLLLETGYKIVEKMKSSPLAAKTVGRLLRNHLDLDHWTRVLESKEWELQEKEGDIMPALKLSYDYLPFHLQQCFSYCALFPPDYKFKSKELINFWIGLDILQSGGQNKTVEDTGLDNLNDLVSYGFLKKDETEEHPYYIIHDLLHDLALKVASNECLSIDSFNVRDAQIPLSIRHLSIIFDNDRMAKEDFMSELIKLKARLKVQNLQTLMIFGEAYSFSNTLSDLLREATALRVLYCHGIDETIRFDLPPLVHLRYLRLVSLYGWSKLFQVPKTLSRFYHLRILEFRNLYLQDLRRDMSDLTRYVYIDWFPNLQKLEITNCPKVVSLPPIPWTKTLCSVRIINVGSKIGELVYEKSPSSVKLKIRGNDGPHIIDEKVLAFHNLTDLQLLNMWHCKLLELKYLQMLTSLKEYRVEECQSSKDLIEVKWGPLGEHVLVYGDPASGKELAQLFSHLRKLSSLKIRGCKRITRVAVENSQHATTPVSSASLSSLKMEDPKSTCHQEQTAAEAEDKEKVNDGLLLLPAHLSDSLRELWFSLCLELSLLVYPLPDKYEAGGQCELQHLRCLQELEISDCPKFFSAYETSSSASWCPFPSSLQSLWLVDCGRDFRSMDLWPLITRGQLMELTFRRCPNLFVGLDSIIGALQDEQRPPSRSSKLRSLDTDDIAGVLAAPICTLFSSSLTNLEFVLDHEVERFTKEQDEALQLLTSLQGIEFWICNKLQCLPAGLHRLPNLKTLRIYSCPVISSLPKDGLPSSLQVLDASRCGNKDLIQQCRNFVRDHPRVELK
ncbi:hypothetical protein ACP70R_022569 [Stipagrostis hirtigluma subsp. patula]